MSLTLTIVRHGNTFAPGELPRRIGARTDLPLVPGGEAQAAALGAYFAQMGERFDRLLVSPLARTRRTAEIIGASLPAAPLPETCSWLAEIDHGPDENQSEDAVLARIGAAALERWSSAMEVPPGWTVDAPARLSAWRALLSQARGHVLIVTSAGAARFAIAADPALAAQAATLPSTKLRTGAWGRIVVTDGIAAITAWDRRPEDD